jgi:hypothetical protein
VPEASLTRIDISKEYPNFSAGHFTMFSATERENLHGHNFQVRCSVTAPPGDDSMAFDQIILKLAPNSPLRAAALALGRDLTYDPSVTAELAAPPGAPARNARSRARYLLAMLP